MVEQIVCFNTAELAKLKGLKIDFDSDDLLTFGHINFFGKHHSTGGILPLSVMFWETHPNAQQFIDLNIYAPSQTVMQKWLREKHGIHITVSNKSMEDFEGKYFPVLDYGLHMGESKRDNVVLYTSYELALEMGLFEGLKLIK